jgi:DDE_Tnp_1-associated
VAPSAIAVADRELVAPAAAGTGARSALLEPFGLVRDGRSGQGRDHPVAAMLLLAAAAVVAGMKGYTAIAGWVKDVPPPGLADLYMRAGGSSARQPSKATIWRVVTDAGAEVFDAVVGRWLMSRQAAGEGQGAGLQNRGLLPVRLEGKTVRGQAGLPRSGLLHWNLVDQRVPLDGQPDVGRLHRPLAGSVGPGDPSASTQDSPSMHNRSAQRGDTAEPRRIQAAAQAGEVWICWCSWGDGSAEPSERAVLPGVTPAAHAYRFADGASSSSGTHICQSRAGMQLREMPGPGHKDH